MLSLNNKQLYVILDTGYVNRDDLCETAQVCCEAGVDIIQYRNYALSDADSYDVCRRLRLILASHNVPFIINNRLDLALAVDADGVHLGQDDMPVAAARAVARSCGKDLIIGLSTHSVDQALQARRENPDYMAIGPLFATTTKPDYSEIGLTTAHQVVTHVTDIPVFGIGGVNLNRLSEILYHGIRRVAVVSAILQAHDKHQTIETFKRLLRGETNG